MLHIRHTYDFLNQLIHFVLVIRVTFLPGLEDRRKMKESRFEGTLKHVKDSLLHSLLVDRSED